MKENFLSRKRYQLNEISLKSSFIIARVDEYRHHSARTDHQEELIGRPAKSLVSVADVPALADGRRYSPIRTTMRIAGYFALNTLFTQ